MTCILRFFMVLLCLALPHTALASTFAAASGMGCHEMAPQAHTKLQAGMAHTLAATPSYDVYSTYSSAHLLQQVSPEHTHADCDCATKCGCLQHCATAGLMVQSSWGILTPALPMFIAAVATDLPSTRISPLFRPPIALS